MVCARKVSRFGNLHYDIGKKIVKSAVTSKSNSPSKLHKKIQISSPLFKPLHFPSSSMSHFSVCSSSSSLFSESSSTSSSSTFPSPTVQKPESKSLKKKEKGTSIHLPFQLPTPKLSNLVDLDSLLLDGDYAGRPIGFILAHLRSLGEYDISNLTVAKFLVTFFQFLISFRRSITSHQLHQNQYPHSNDT